MNTNSLIVRKSEEKDFENIFNLYKLVSKAAGGLARSENEITADYIRNFVEKSIKNGVQFVIEDTLADGIIVAEIHCYKLEPLVFGHVLGELTIAISPFYQGKGLGKRIFQCLLDYIKQNRKDILRVELIARESNKRAISLYESLGFKAEGKFKNRIKTREGFFEADIPMAWFNPNYEN